MEITIKATPEEIAELFSEPKAENATTIKVSKIASPKSAVDRLLDEAEFYRKQKQFGRVASEKPEIEAVMFGPLKGTGSPQENLKRVLLDIAGEYGIKF